MGTETELERDRANGWRIPPTIPLPEHLPQGGLRYLRPSLQSQHKPPTSFGVSQTVVSFNDKRTGFADHIEG